MHTNWIGMYTMVRREVRRTFRVVVQTLVSPTISAALYIFIFGYVIGSRIDEIVGVPYITFVFPGILMLSVINAAFGSSSGSLYFARFSRSVDEILVSPFSYVEMILGFMCGGIIRALLVSAYFLVPLRLRIHFCFFSIYSALQGFFRSSACSLRFGQMALSNFQFSIRLLLPHLRTLGAFFTRLLCFRRQRAP